MQLLPPDQTARTGLALEVGESLVSLVDDAHSVGPVDPEGHVIPPHSPRARRDVGRGHLVEDLRSILQRQEPVGEPLGLMERQAILGGQLNGDPALEGW